MKKINLLSNIFLFFLFLMFMVQTFNYNFVKLNKPLFYIVFALIFLISIIFEYYFKKKYDQTK